MTVKRCILIASVMMVVMLCACTANKDTGKSRLDELKKKMEENVASAEESGEPQEKMRIIFPPLLQAFPLTAGSYR